MSEPIETKGMEWSGRIRRPPPDSVLLDRALGILHRMATERTGWRRFFSRWYYSDEPLRNDAVNLVREAGFGMMMPLDSQLLGEDAIQRAVEQALTDNG